MQLSKPIFSVLLLLEKRLGICLLAILPPLLLESSLCVEESLGTAEQGTTQYRTDWIAPIETLAAEVITFRCQISDNHLGNRVLGGLATSHDSVK